ncbi:FimB/Mfa2 family fimbrial subunit [Bacteroides rodentium]|uniref:FimB/Mfa2 family fimbrial subunit n=1 Tax=Bacteroides rodentium TaxID=691816 RepID=UPI00046E805B|nr:FimB/Mfa2 family fimbrial subunit [Bacteroides rodentium]
MQSNKRHRLSRFASSALVALATAAALTAAVALASCERIFEDLDPCPHGVSLRFVYDYNMEFANAFPAQVDCLTLLIYDDEDNYVDTKTVTGAELQDEDYRMKLDLEEGEYHFVAYGGMACRESSFGFGNIPAEGSRKQELTVEMNDECLVQPVGKPLHDLFWGELTLATADLYSEGTVKMMKDTNGIRIVLQQADGGTVNADDFDFEITDDNTLFDHTNDLVANGTATYTPWAQGQAQTGVSIVGQSQVEPIPVEVAYAELSTSRLMTKNAPRLTVKRHADGNTVIDLPLNKYLLLMKSDRYHKMADQEYLDRESRWTLFFFLQGGTWLNTRIVVNDWVVRINDIEM